MSTNKKDIVGFTFVDNTDLCVSAVNSTPIQTLQKLQAAVTNWKGLLKVTGGALFPDKCFWYLIDQYWDNRKWVYQKKEQTLAELMVADEHGWEVQIPCQDTHEA